MTYRSLAHREFETPVRAQIRRVLVQLQSPPGSSEKARLTLEACLSRFGVHRIEQVEEINLPLLLQYLQAYPTTLERRP